MEIAETHESILDYLDMAPLGQIVNEDGEATLVGRMASIQWLAGAIDRSDSTVRRAVRHLEAWGLVKVVPIIDNQGRRRLYVSAGPL